MMKVWIKITGVILFILTSFLLEVWISNYNGLPVVLKANKLAPDYARAVVSNDNKLISGNHRSNVFKGKKLISDNNTTVVSKGKKCSKLLLSLPTSTLLLIYLNDSTLPLSHLYTCIVNNSQVIIFTPVVTSEDFRKYSSVHNSFQVLTWSSNNTYHTLATNMATALVKSTKDYAIYINLGLTYKNGALDINVGSDGCFFHTDNAVIGGYRHDVACTLQCMYNYVTPESGGLVNVSSKLVAGCARQRRTCSSPITQPSKQSRFKKDAIDFGCYCSMYSSDLPCDEPETSSQCVRKEFPKNRSDSFVDVHVAYSSNSAQYIGMVASIRSVISTTQYRSRLHIHIFECIDCNYTQSSDIRELCEEIKECGVNVKLHEFSSNEVLPYINKHQTNRPDLRIVNTYIRLLLAQKLPHVNKCMWLDSDVLVVKDIVPFLNSIQTNKVIAAFPTIKPYSKEKAVKVLKEMKFPPVDGGNTWFISGTIVINLQRWRETNTTDLILKLSALNAKHKLYTYGADQPALNLLFGGDRFLHLNPDLLQLDLGWKKGITITCASQFLHWNGEHKPWTSKPMYENVWKRLKHRTFHLKRLKCGSSF